MSHRPVIVVNTLLTVLDGSAGVLGQFEKCGVAGAAVGELYFVRTTSCSPGLTECFDGVLQT